MRDDSIFDIMGDPDADRARDARRMAWNTGFAIAADAVENGGRDLASFPEAVRPGVERELQARRDLADDCLDAEAFERLLGFRS